MASTMGAQTLPGPRTCWHARIWHIGVRTHSFLLLCARTWLFAGSMQGSVLRPTKLPSAAEHWAAKQQRAAKVRREANEKLEAAATKAELKSKLRESLERQRDTRRKVRNLQACMCRPTAAAAWRRPFNVHTSPPLRLTNAAAAHP